MFALLLDPLDFYNRFKPPEWPTYDVSVEAFLYVLVGLIVWTSILTFHDLNKRTHQGHLKPNMPLHEVCRWIARDSTWASDYPEQADQEWISNVDDELMSQVGLRGMAVFGQPNRSGQLRHGPYEKLPEEFLKSAQWDSSKLTSEEPPTHMWSSDNLSAAVYYRVMMDRNQVTNVWPKKPFLARLMRRSPIQRLGGYEQIFADQDSNYAKNAGFSNVPLEAILGH